jgi:hypothetical protein
MKYRDNMTAHELSQFMSEINALDAVYTAVAEHDAIRDLPDEYEDQSDYVGMGWIGKDGRP